MWGDIVEFGTYVCLFEYIKKKTDKQKKNTS